MGISAIGSATNVPVNTVASDGDSAAVEAKESKAVKLTEQQNGGIMPKAASASASAGKKLSNTSDLVKLKMYANQHMSVSQIARRLGKSVSAVMQEAAVAGINLNTPSSSTAIGNPAIGNNVNTTA